MEKKLYERPTMQVVQLQQQGHLMEVSNRTEGASLNKMNEEEDL